MFEMQEITSVKSLSLSEQVFDRDHEQVVFCHDQEIGLKAIIAIHSTILGPAMGGTRLWHYDNEEDALRDVLRLSRGMTYKSALAGLNLGGGKAVIIGTPSQKNEFLLRRFGAFVHTLGGRYWTAEDVNMSPSDMEYIRMETPYVVGMPIKMGGSGDPSPMTAYGVLIAIKAAAQRAYGSDSLHKKRVVVEGVGNVGTRLVEYLVSEGAQVKICDVNEQKLKSVVSKYSSVEVISQEEVYTMDADILSPCALGGTLNPETISQLRYNIIAGAANNQLQDETRDGSLLAERGIIYAPDFMINAGGIINVYYEYQRIYDKELAIHHIDKTYETIIEVLDKSQQQQISTHQAALQIAKQRISSVRQLHKSRAV